METLTLLSFVLTIKIDLLRSGISISSQYYQHLKGKC